MESGKKNRKNYDIATGSATANRCWGEENSGETCWKKIEVEIIKNQN